MDRPLADIFMTYTFKWASDEDLVGMNPLLGFPRPEAYVARHDARPAFPRELYRS